MSEQVIFKLKREIDYLKKEIAAKDKHIQELLESGGKIREYLEAAEDMLRNLVDMDIRVLMERKEK